MGIQSNSNIKVIRRRTSTVAPITVENNTSGGISAPDDEYDESRFKLVENKHPYMWLIRGRSKDGYLSKLNFDMKAYAEEEQEKDETMVTKVSREDDNPCDYLASLTKHHLGRWLDSGETFRLAFELPGWKGMPKYVMVDITKVYSTVYDVEINGLRTPPTQDTSKSKVVSFASRPHAKIKVSDQGYKTRFTVDYSSNSSSRNTDRTGLDIFKGLMRQLDDGRDFNICMEKLIYTDVLRKGW